MTAKELLEKAEELRRNARFGDAINFYRAAAEAPDATEDIIKKCCFNCEYYKSCYMGNINKRAMVEDLISKSIK